LPASSRQETEEEIKEVVYTPFVELSDGRLAEQAWDGIEPLYLLYDPETDKVTRVEYVEDDGVEYYPVDNDEVKVELTLFPTTAFDYESDEQLFKDIIEFLNRWHEAPSERDRKLDALYVLLTYVYDLLPRVPYRRMLGALGRGKSAWLKTVGYICYRPIKLAGCDTDKAIVRRLNTWRGTALIDEADFGDSSLYAFITKILNLGYDREIGYYQRCDDDDSTKTITYNVFGPKLLACRAPYKDAALESRCITTVAKEKTKPMPLARMERFHTEAELLRGQLILWRFRHYWPLKEKVKILEKPEFEQELKLQRVTSRIKEVLAPLCLISDAFKADVTQLAYELDEELRSSREFQLEIEFGEALLKIMDEAEEDGDETRRGDDTYRTPSTLKAYLNPEGQTSNEQEEVTLRIPLVKIARTILDDPEADRSEVSGLARSLSRMIRSRLGFKVIQGHGRRRYVEIPPSYLRTVTTLLSVTIPKRKVITIE